MATKAFALVLILFLWDSSVVNSEDLPSFGPLVTKESRRIMVSTESGMITAVDVQDRPRGAYQLQFITMEPSSLFLPVILHADMVFFVHTGRGKVSYITGEEDSKEAATKSIDVERGDVYRLEHGTVFYVQSYPSQTREKLRIHAIFATVDQENPFEPSFGAYSNITDLVRGFDERVLQMGFGVSEEVVRDIKGGEKTPSIMPYTRRNETEKLNWKEGVFEAIIGVRDPSYFVNKKKKKKKTESKAFNFYSSKPDEENCYGWSTAVTYKDLHALRGSNIGLFMVNLTTGSMMGPHWNPKATEIAIVIQGQGMVQIVCPTDPSGQSSGTDKCQNALFRVKEGDVFIVPKFHPMAQISFNNDSFVFVGFSTNAETNHPQFLAGSRSVLQVIDRKILAMSFNAANTTVEGMLASQNDAIILSCTSCAEELERKMEEEHPEEEEARRREEEEARKRQEEEEARRREEEEARRRQEEEEGRRRQEEEEARRRREEGEEEARRREQEEEKRRQEEEAARRQQEEEARRREEEEARRRQEEEEARRREEEEEARRREEEQRRQQEEEAARQQEEEEARRREEEQEGGGGGEGEQEGGGGEERREWGEVVKMGVLKVPPREVLTV